MSQTPGDPEPTTAPRTCHADTPQHGTLTLTLSRQSRERRCRKCPGQAQPLHQTHRRDEVCQPRSGGQDPGAGGVEGLHHQPDRPDCGVCHRCRPPAVAHRKELPHVQTRPEARPVYHHKRESIEAHLTIVFAALAVSHWLEHQTGWSIKKFVRTARRYRTVQIRSGRQTLTAADPLPDDLRGALAKIATHDAH